MACSSWKKLRSLIVLMQPRNGVRRLLESGRLFVLNLFMYGFFVNPPFSLEWLFPNTSLSYYSLSLSNAVDTVNYKTTVKGVQVCFLSVSVTSQGPYNPLVSQYNDTAQTNILFFFSLSYFKTFLHECTTLLLRMGWPSRRWSTIQRKLLISMRFSLPWNNVFDVISCWWKTKQHSNEIDH